MAAKLLAAALEITPEVVRQNWTAGQVETQAIFELLGVSPANSTAK